MARLNPEKVCALLVDGAQVLAPETALIADLLPTCLVAVSTLQRAGSDQARTRRHLDNPLPAAPGPIALTSKRRTSW